eukprot:TRINITY_DN1470_c0_g2_i1.p1 TRINITY_DN1470_c0_g2~~TRINITY_DN1470_c0_g2_i1.p1  ORF type:complete len:485 (+),score=165.68 TRINITY_DN1470_c0_g2_i1:294-1748(+)
MAEKKGAAVRVFAKEIVSSFGPFLQTDRSAEAAKPYNVPAKKDMLKGWINGIITIRGYSLEEFGDLKRGSHFLVLLETLCGTRLTTGYRKPRTFVEMANNLEIFLKFMKHNGIDVGNIAAMDLYEGKFEKLLTIILLLAKNFTEQSDTNKTFDVVNKSAGKEKTTKRLSQKFDKKLQTLEIKLEQAKLDHIYQLAAIHQAELDKEEALRKEKEKEKKKFTAMALISQTEVSRVPLFFTVHLPDGAKDVRDFDATLSLVELLESICTLKNWNSDDFIFKSMDGKDVDMDFVLGEVKDREVKLEKCAFVEQAQKVDGQQKTEKRIKRIAKPAGLQTQQSWIANANATAAANTNATETTTAAPARRAFTRQNSYIAIKAWNPEEDADEMESRKRVKQRNFNSTIGESKLKDIKSPLVVAMEREHKAILDKLNLEGIKLPPETPKPVEKLADIKLDALDRALKEIEKFENVYGANQEYSSDNFFRGLL